MFNVNVKYDQYNEKIYFECDEPSAMRLGCLLQKNKLNPGVGETKSILSLPVSAFSDFAGILNILTGFNVKFDSETRVPKYKKEDESNLLNDLSSPSDSSFLASTLKRLDDLKMDSKGLLEEYFKHNKVDEPECQRRFNR